MNQGKKELASIKKKVERLQDEREDLIETLEELEEEAIEADNMTLRDEAEKVRRKLEK